VCLGDTFCDVIREFHRALLDHDLLVIDPEPFHTPAKYYELFGHSFGGLHLLIASRLGEDVLATLYDDWRQGKVLDGFQKGGVMYERRLRELKEREEELCVDKKD
jgi:hypothetical protein